MSHSFTTVGPSTEDGPSSLTIPANLNPQRILEEKKQRFDAMIRDMACLDAIGLGESDCNSSSTSGNFAASFDEITILDTVGTYLYPSSLLWSEGLREGRPVPGPVPPNGIAELLLVTYPPASLTRDQRLVAIPDAASVQSKMAELLELIGTPPVQISQLLSTSSSFERSLLEVGLSAKYMGSSLDANYKQTFMSRKSGFIFNIKQKYFTMSCPLFYRPSDFFADRVIDDELIFKIEQGVRDNLGKLLYVSAVTFGRQIFGVIATDLERSEARGKIKASIEAIGSTVSASVEAETIREVNTFDKLVRVYGGGSVAPLADLEQGITTWLQEPYDPETARYIISFQTRCLNGNIATFTDTASYPCPPKYQLHSVLINCYEVRDENLDRDCDIYAELTDGSDIIHPFKLLYEGEWNQNGSMGIRTFTWEQAVDSPSDLRIKFKQTNRKANPYPHFRMRVESIKLDLTSQGVRRIIEASPFDHAQAGDQLFDHEPTHINFHGDYQTTPAMQISFAANF
jgi:hypothetical protein